MWLGALLPHFLKGEYTAATVGFAITGAWFFLCVILVLHWLSVFD